MEMTETLIPTQTTDQTAADAKCPHTPRCPDAHAPDHLAAHVIADHPEQGWSLRCNGVVLFYDEGELIEGHRVDARGAQDDLIGSDARMCQLFAAGVR